MTRTERSVSTYEVDVPLRWSDQDPYRHINHATIVTLLEDARTALLFDAAVREGVAAFEAGLLVATVHVAYRRPIPWDRRGVRARMWCEQVRAASFTVGYELLLPTGGPAGGGGVKVSRRQRLEMCNFMVPRELAPVECDYRGFHIVSAPPPSSTAPPSRPRWWPPGTVWWPGARPRSGTRR